MMAMDAQTPLTFLGWLDVQWDLAASVATTVGAFGALIAVWVAVVQFRAAKRSEVEASLPVVVVSPMPELTHGRETCLLIKNFGPTSAYGLRIEFPNEWPIVTLPDGTGLGLKGTTLPTPVTTLAPQQEFTVWVKAAASADASGVFETTVRVTCEDWRGKTRTTTSRIGWRRDAPWGASDRQLEATEHLKAIAAQLRKWSAPDGRSLIFESPDGARKRIWGDAPTGTPEAPDPAAD